MRLNDRLRALHSEIKGDDGVIHHGQVADRLKKALNGEELWAYARADIVRRSKQLATKSSRSVVVPITGHPQRDLFEGLQDAYVIADRDEVCTKETDRLTLAEFEQIVSVRKRQIKADLESLRPAERVLRAIKPLWAANPEWVFAEVRKAWLAAQSKAKGKAA
jgi:hypothetical protein